ncbi:unnamed protein product [Nyctereutes procyonoides]|uniref:Guanine nucleotide-binding protein subunit gamma n=1 Tax=Nyctereutes procyonoides TaxID=34880 RepID=A0A811YH51_NYCPR|nr:unnamed protein product [Nyctereutes procyonoides]
MKVQATSRNKICANHIAEKKDLTYRLYKECSQLISRKQTMQVSKASVDLMSYCEEHARSDPLLIGIPTSENSFKVKKKKKNTCIILRGSSPLLNKANYEQLLGRNLPSAYLVTTANN